MRANVVRTALFLAVALGVRGAGPARAVVLATPGGIRFTYKDPNAREVLLAGSFNNWTGAANPMVREEGGTWAAVVRLEPGTYEYKFIADGQWVADPENPVTVGDYGNSGLTIAPDGTIARMEATSNVPFSSKILLTGRIIGLFQSIANRANGDRYELRRPRFDTDLLFSVRVNDVMDARVLANIETESENIELYRTRLNFDRGVLHFNTKDLEGWAWDNEGIENWDDPLRLVGDVGIYHHRFGYNTQGATGRAAWRGLEARLLYSDVSLDGGGSEAVPPVDTLSILEDRTVIEAGVYRFAADRVTSYTWSYIGNDEDVAAFRGRGTWGGAILGLSARRDRGYNPGSLTIVDALGADSAGARGLRTIYPKTLETWQAAGLDVSVPDAWRGLGVRFEALWGGARVEALGRGSRDTVLLVTAVEEGDTIATLETLAPAVLVDEEDFDLDESRRWLLSLADSTLPWDLAAEASVEGQRHEFADLATDSLGTITNRMTVWRAGLARRGVSVLGRALRPALRLEYFDFDYDLRSPWENQFWFDFRNFWLDNGEHVVSFEKMTLLGGRNAVIVRPRLAVDLVESPAVGFEYEGTIAGHGLDTDPKYVESLVRVTWRIAPRWRFHSDTRFAKYNDPVLGLFEAYNESFHEVRYEVAPGIEVSLAYGVDPYVIDPPVNEYAYIGRDQFLFARGANGSTARTRYLDLSGAIADAEEALERERRFQVEAIVRF